MAKKSAPRKQKPNLPRRRIILAIIGVVVVISAVFLSVSSLKKQELERQDRERFTALEVKIKELQSQLNSADGSNAWAIEKSCQKPGIKFYSGDAGTCTIETKLTGNSRLKIQDAKNILSSLYRINQEGYSKYSRTNYLEFSASIDRINCVFYYNLGDNKILSEGSLVCNGDALHMYYAEPN